MTTPTVEQAIEFVQFALDNPNEWVDSDKWHASITAVIQAARECEQLRATLSTMAEVLEHALRKSRKGSDAAKYEKALKCYMGEVN